MKSINSEKKFLEALVKGLAKHLGKNSEIVLHDYNNNFEKTIVAIENGKISGRKIGESGTIVGLKLLDGDVAEDGVYNYLMRTQDGRNLHSSTIYIKDENNKVIGSLCINTDITDLMLVKDIISDSVNIKSDNNDNNNNAGIVYNNVEDMLLDLIDSSIRHVGVPVKEMSREQKIRGIKYLEKAGAFKIKKSVSIIAKHYATSKFTIYNYIDSENKNDK